MPTDLKKRAVPVNARAPSQGRTSAAPSHRHSWPAHRVILATLMGFAFLYWLWVALAWQSVTTDPGISILAAKSILEHGYPLLPSGYMYYKGALSSYLVAGSMAVFGENDLAIAAPSIALGLGSLLLIYILARDVLGRPWLGVAAAAFLLVVQVNTHYATSPRMYMTLQFTTVAAVYFAWRGHIRGERAFRYLALAAVAAAILSHFQGGLLTIAIPTAVMAALAHRGGMKAAVTEVPRLAGYLVLCALFLVFVIGDNLPGALETIALRGGVAAHLSGLNVDLARWASQLNWLEQTVPLGAMLLPAVAFVGLTALRDRRGDESTGAVYVLLLLLLWVVGSLAYIRVSGERFWMGILPIHALVLIRGLVALRDSLRHGRRLAAYTLAWSGVVVVAFSLVYGLFGYPSIVRAAYGVPCTFREVDCGPDMKREYVEFRHALAEDDLVIAAKPHVANYYLGRVDGWLVQRRVNETYTAFDERTDEYFGIRLVDSPAELEEIAASHPRVWVIVHNAQDRDLGPELKAHLEQHFERRSAGAALTVYRAH